MKQVFGFAVRCTSLTLADDNELGQYLAVFCAKANVVPEDVVVLKEAEVAVQKKAAKRAHALLLGGARRPHLTMRENQVLEKIKLGWSNKEIADHLNISVRTVKHHVMLLFGKFEAKKRFDLITI